MEKSMSVTSEKVRNYIHGDLALCILSKLPLKSLKRFGCVRKSWSILFENHHFMSIFRNNFISCHHSYNDDTSLMLQSTSRDFHSLSGDKLENTVKLNWQNPFQEEDPSLFVLDSGSIAGILCLYKLDGRVVLWNPTIDEFKIVTPDPLHSISPSHVVLFNPLGFGYDTVRDDYKLIRCVTYYPLASSDCDFLGIPYTDVPQERSSILELYSLRSNTWRKLHVSVFVFKSCSNVSGERLYLNEMCHWWHVSATHDGVDLASFDLGNEVFFTTPISLDIYSRAIYLVGLNDFIALISWIFGTTTFDISILGEVGVKESWTKLYSVGPFFCIEHPIGTGKNRDIFFRKEDGEIVCFNLRTQMIEELCIKGEDFSHIFIYKKSLLPIGTGKNGDIFF